MKAYESDLESRTDERTQLGVIRDFLESPFDAVERDGILVSQTNGDIFVKESHGVGVPEDAPDVSEHQYWLLWFGPFDEVIEEIEEQFDWTVDTIGEDS